jgi:hypothetical protein
MLLAASLALPVQAQDGPEPRMEEEAPSVPLFEFFERMLRGFMTEIEPQMRDLERGFEALEPELQAFLERLRGMAQYHPPEVLPNGDILIRRREAEEVPPEDEEVDGGSEILPFEL